MKEQRLELAIGIVVLIGLVMLAILVLQFGRFEYAFGIPYTVRAYFPTASGVKRGAPVRLLGVEVGETRSVKIKPEKNQVQIKLQIRPGVRIRKDAVLRIRSEGIISNFFLEFSQGPPAAGEAESQYLPMDGTAVVFGQRAFTLEETLERLGETSQDLSRLTTALNDLLGDEAFRNDLKKSASNLSATLAEGPHTLEKFQAASDELKEVAAKGETVMENLNTLTETLRLTVEEQREPLREFMKNLTLASDRLNRSLRAISDMAEATRQGKGTFGRLMSDEELYEELVFAVKDAREAIAATKETVDFFREHPDAILKGKPKEKATSK